MADRISTKYVWDNYLFFDEHEQIIILVTNFNLKVTSKVLTFIVDSSLLNVWNNLEFERGWGRKATHKYIGLKATIVFYRIIGYTDIYRIKGYSISGDFWIYRKKGYTFLKNIQEQRLHFSMVYYLPLHFTPFTTILKPPSYTNPGHTHADYNP